ncbi:MAG: PKD domain-containing protein [Bacteroidales bacterium]|nr:PKD domain-containing protein [Bacteroidales bacterium]MCF8403670.1 PKD domain-containing protein [Bacteroidales bacterium]
MIAEAYELFGCNTADIFVMSIATGDDNAACIAFDLLHGIEFPTISGVEGGGTQINNTYGIGAYPTYILIAPNHDIVEQDIWPMPSVQTLINAFQSNGVAQAECGGLTAGFISDATEICEYDAVNFTDLSSGVITSWNWTFEGGDPATSSEQNPTVTYNTAGTYNVELEVSDGTTTNTLLMEDYIEVNTSPPAMLNPFSDVCLTWPAFELTGGTPAGGVYSGPGVTNGWFDPNVAGIGTHAIVYTYTGLNGCDNSAEQTILVDPCTGITEFGNNLMQLYPNPAIGSVNIKVNYNGKISISVISALGDIIYFTEEYSTQDYVRTINLENISDGLYFVKLQTAENTYTQKLKIAN